MIASSNTISNNLARLDKFIANKDYATASKTIKKIEELFKVMALNPNISSNLHARLRYLMSKIPTVPQIGVDMAKRPQDEDEHGFWPRERPKEWESIEAIAASLNEDGSFELAGKNNMSFIKDQKSVKRFKKFMRLKVDKLAEETPETGTYIGNQTSVGGRVMRMTAGQQR